MNLLVEAGALVFQRHQKGQQNPPVLIGKDVPASLSVYHK
ncbi:hypothetical protein BSM4216_3540 [Bacillus smithii]|nr:hypothetical protein BSM4216_3540 [Bacillus smithii]